MYARRSAGFKRAAVQQPKHWSGMLSAITLFVSETGLVAKMPPPWSVIPVLPLKVLWVTLLPMRTSGPPGGPFGTAASKIPPPRADPARPLALAVFPLTVEFRSVMPPSPA